jgi:hypothetical protein
MPVIANQELMEKAPGPERRDGAARLLAYLGIGGEVAILPGGLALAVQADHLAEVIRLDDLRETRKIY